MVAQRSPGRWMKGCDPRGPILQVWYPKWYPEPIPHQK